MYKLYLTLLCEYLMHAMRPLYMSHIANLILKILAASMYAILCKTTNDPLERNARSYMCVRVCACVCIPSFFFFFSE